MLIDPYMRARLGELRVQEQIAAADRARLARLARTRPVWRIALVRLAARGLRVEREIEFEVARADGR
jgi:hypothetical protein